MSDSSALAGSRLLVLGAGPYQLPVIRRATELGCHVITADYLPNNPGHRLAAVSEIVSTVDESGILDVAKRHLVDGVLTYGSDVSVRAVSFAAEELGLSGNPYRVVCRLQRKDQFRRLQRALGLPHPRFAAASTHEALIAECTDLSYPALVKPVDSSGSKGQAVARSKTELKSAFDRARPFARCGVIIAEELLAQDIMELVGEVLIEDGWLAFAQYGHNWFCDEVQPRVPAGEIVPGAVPQDVMAELDRQLQALVSGAGLRTGCMNFDALLSQGKVVLLDVGLRNGGNLFADVINLSTGVDLTTAAIYASLGLRFEVPSLHVDRSRTIVSHVVHSHVPDGRFESVQLDPAVAPWLIRESIFASDGDPIAAYTRGDAGIGIIIFEQPDAPAAASFVQRHPHPARIRLHASL